MGFAVLERVEAGLHNGFGRNEIRLTNAQRDDIFPGGGNVKKPPDAGGGNRLDAPRNEITHDLFKSFSFPHSNLNALEVRVPADPSANRVRAVGERLRTLSYSNPISEASPTLKLRKRPPTLAF